MTLILVETTQRFTNMKMILQGCQDGFNVNVTVGKAYELDSGRAFFTDDSGSVRSTGPFAWKTIMNDKQEQKLHEHKAGEPLTRKQIIAKSKAFGTQEGGTHYTDQELQPLEATYLRYGLSGLKAAIHTKVDKYITRKKDDEVGQLKKAGHCLAILIEITELENDYS